MVNLVYYKHDLIELQFQSRSVYTPYTDSVQRERRVRTTVHRHKEREIRISQLELRSSKERIDSNKWKFFYFLNELEI